MKTLETEFNVQGHFLRQIWHDGDVAVFARSLSPKHKAHELEMVIIRIEAESKTPSGSIVPERQAYPRPSQWGTFGWSFPARYHEWVLALAEKLYGIKKDRPSFVRDVIHQHWLGNAVV